MGHFKTRYAMKISQALIAVAAATPIAQNESESERGVRGFAGPSSLLYGESYWPVTDCTRHQNCWASKVALHEGWEDYDVKFLMCDIETGTCMCKTGYMDADDDRYNGCETKINQGKCPYGSCENHGVSDGEQRGAWKFLHCDESTENGCCECDESARLQGGGCVGDDAYAVAADAPCGLQCEALCNSMTDNTANCMSLCDESQFECEEEESEEPEEESDEDDEATEDEDETEDEETEEVTEETDDETEEETEEGTEDETEDETEETEEETEETEEETEETEE